MNNSTIDSEMIFLDVGRCSFGVSNIIHQIVEEAPNREKVFVAISPAGYDAFRKGLDIYVDAIRLLIDNSDEYDKYIRKAACIHFFDDLPDYEAREGQRIILHSMRDRLDCLAKQYETMSLAEDKDCIIVIPKEHSSLYDTWPMNLVSFERALRGLADALDLQLLYYLNNVQWIKATNLGYLLEKKSVYPFSSDFASLLRKTFIIVTDDAELKDFTESLGLACVYEKEGTLLSERTERAVLNIYKDRLPDFELRRIQAQ